MTELKENFLSVIHVRSAYEAVTNVVLTIISFLLGYYGKLVLDNIDLFMAIATVVFVDAVFGNILAFKNGNWQVKKAMKVIYYIMAYSITLSMVLSVEKAHPAAFWLSEAIIMPILLFQSISVLKNMSLLGMLPKSLLTEILDKIDGHKNNSLQTTEP